MNIKITKDELFDNFIFKFNVSSCRNHLNTQNIDFPNGRINFFFFILLVNYSGNLLILQIKKFWNFFNRLFLSGIQNIE